MFKFVAALCGALMLALPAHGATAFATQADALLRSYADGARRSISAA